MGDSCKKFNFSAVADLLQLFLDDNIGVQIEGELPAKLSVFSAKNVVFEHDIDFTKCMTLGFLICSQGGFKFDPRCDLGYVKIGNQPARQAEKAIEFINECINMRKEGASD